MKTSAILSLFIALPLFAAETSVSRLSQVRDSYPQLSPDGSQIVFQSNRNGTNQVWLMNRDGSGLVQITDVPGEGAETPVWSPDGEWIAYAAYLGENNNDVFVMKRDGTGNRQITSGPGYDGHPHWSADGQRIVINSDRDTPDHSVPWNRRFHDIWSIRPDGSDARKHTHCEGVCTFGSFSPDGKQLLFRKVDVAQGLNWALEVIEKNSEIYISDLDGNNARVLASHPAFDGWPLWSPDGAWIVFASNRAGPALTGQLWMVKPDGQDLRQVTHGDWGHAQPAFTADGKALTAYRFQEFTDHEYGGIAIISLSSFSH